MIMLIYMRKDQYGFVSLLNMVFLANHERNSKL